MKYIAQYIKKLCPNVVIEESKTTESVYYQMGHNFVVRLSEHIGWYEKGKISVVKSFNTEHFIVMLDLSPFPLIKTRKEVKEMLKNLYEYNTLMGLSKDFHTAKQKAEIESLTDWDKFFSKTCGILANARYLSSLQKDILKGYFNKRGVRGERMLNVIKKIKPVTSVETVKEFLEKEKAKGESGTKC